MGILDFLFKKPSYGGSVSELTKRNVSKDWENINILINQKSPSSLRNALIIADRSLDSVLRDKVSGETLGERLKDSERLFDRSLYNKIWEAHKLRNTLVHEAGFEPSHFVVTEAIENLRSALIVLGIRL